MLVASTPTNALLQSTSVKSVMPNRPDFILTISIRNIEDFSPDSVAKSPRTFRPQDVVNACKNLAMTPSKDCPADVLTIAQFVAVDFFALAHSSGLFNRQIKLWEALARTQKVEVQQMSKGLFSKTKLPEYDLSLIDQKGRATVYARFASGEAGQNFDYLRDCKEFFKRIEPSSALAGVFLIYPKPFPKNVLEYIRKETNSADALARFESILPKLNVPCNLAEFSRAAIYDPSAGAQKYSIQLVHPDLSRKKFGGGGAQGVSFQTDSLDTAADDAE